MNGAEFSAAMFRAVGNKVDDAWLYLDRIEHDQAQVQLEHRRTRSG